MLSLWLFQTVVPGLHVESLVVSDIGSRPSCCLSGCFRQWFQAFMLSLWLFQTVVPGLHVESLVVSDSGSRPSC